MTASALLPPRGRDPCVGGVTSSLSLHDHPSCDVTLESGYGGSDTSFSSVTSCGISSRPCDLLDRTLPSEPDCKRPRCEVQEQTTNTITTTSTGITTQLAVALPQSKTGHSKEVSPEDDGEIDRRPFKSKLEELLAECRRSDFAISALDRSPIDRMMEATDYIVGIMAYEQIRETKVSPHCLKL
ncbi:unnamed protein product [Echinostoma caproni]|uniref:Uncharacterized protein n=1 Tax=Echinostoma caproni TaxID=27848 RepID=A0A3P8IGW6_9TREM|nr:unnamed protein product [Echinostoma caproni]